MSEIHEYSQLLATINQLYPGPNVAHSFATQHQYLLLLIHYYRPTIIRSILITIFKCIACLSPSVLISRHIRLKTTMLTPVCEVSLFASRRCRVRRTVSSGVRAPRRVLGRRVSLSFDRVRHRQPSVDSRAFGRRTKTVTHVS